MRSMIAVVAASAFVLTACAPPMYSMTPVPGVGQELRYVQGQPTTYSDLGKSSVQVTPLGVENGQLNFGVAAYNTGETSTNFGIENLELRVNGQPTHIYTVAEMEKQAKDAATAALIATVLVGAVATAAAANAQSTSTYRTPHGTYTYTYQNSALNALAASATAASTAVAVRDINDSLDDTLANMSGTVLQTTTIDQDGSYGGRAVSARVVLPETNTLDAMLTVHFGSEDHVFHWNVAKLP